eukprot:3541786-Pleurochrysis_carterae.AAC.1
MAAEIEELKAENQWLRDEITELKGITEPGKYYFHDDGFTRPITVYRLGAIYGHSACYSVRVGLCAPTGHSFVSKS